MKYLKPIIILLGLYFISHLNAQTKDSTAVKYAETITWEELKEHLSILASDEFEGRETGEKGEQMAAFYLAGQFAGMGLPPQKSGTYFQPFPLEKIEPTGIAEILDSTFQMIDDFVYFNASGKEIKIEDLIFAGYGIDSENYSDYKHIDVKGKNIIVLGGEPLDENGLSYSSGDSIIPGTQDDIFGKLIVAEEKGVKHLFIVYDDYQNRIKPYKHFFSSNKMRLKIDEEKDKNETILFIISRKMVDAIFSTQKKTIDQLKSEINKKGKPQPFAFKTSIALNTKSVMKDVTGLNVLGFIEGSDLREEIIVITAHYDHIGKHEPLIYNGADDDGSGTVGLIEIAEAFAKAKADGNGPRRSILVMPVSGEEKGLLGSEYYTDNPVFSIENTIANLNIDMIGRVDDDHVDDPNYVYLIGTNMLSNDLHDLSEWANKTYVGLDLDYRFNSKDEPNNFFRRSDHYNFAKNNIPVIFYFNGTHEDYHEATDTIEKINFEILKKRTKLVFYTAWELANRNEKPRLNSIK